MSGQNRSLLHPDSMDNGVVVPTGSASTADPTSSEASRFSLLERTLEQFQENARHLGVIASDFTPRSQEPLNQKVHTLISGLQFYQTMNSIANSKQVKELDRLKGQFADVRVPLELLDFLDQSKNPQLYTKECLKRTKQKNREVNGKIQLFKNFREQLVRELGEEMPLETLAYLKARGTGSEMASLVNPPNSEANGGDNAS